jgi:multimeric flavodoxin WrbA
MADQKTLLIVWHSRTGASRQAAARAARAARETEPSLEVVDIMAADATAALMLSANAYLFVCPENLASMSGEMKEFFDRTYYDCLDQLNGRAYACVVCAGSDGQGAVRQIERIATGWRLRQVAPSVILVTNAQSGEQILAQKQLDATQLDEAADTGAALAAGLVMGMF